MPQWNTISISGYHIREAGSTAVQELAFTLADGIAYVQAGIDAGLDVDDFAPRLSFFFNSHNDFFEEIAKMRAARRMWARVMRERFGAKRAALLDAALPHPDRRLLADRAAAATTTSCASRSRRWPACSAARSRCTPTRSTRRWRCPREEAVTVALRTQQILAEESGVANTVDPLAGSYFVEALTDRMEREALDYIERIDEMGGMVAAIEAGFPQKEIADASYRYQRQIDDGEKIDRRRQPLRDGGRRAPRDCCGSARRSSASSSSGCERLKRTARRRAGRARAATRSREAAAERART